MFTSRTIALGMWEVSCRQSLKVLFQTDTPASVWISPPQQLLQIKQLCNSWIQLYAHRHKPQIPVLLPGHRNLCGVSEDCTTLVVYHWVAPSLFSTHQLHTMEEIVQSCSHHKVQYCIIQQHYNKPKSFQGRMKYQT